jgi:hypothetical protein
MREIAVITGEEVAKLKDGENDLCIKLEDRKGLKVAVVYYLGDEEPVKSTDDTTEEPVEAPQTS